MTGEQFLTIIEKLIKAYPNFQISNQATQDLWWDYLKDYDNAYIEHAVRVYIATEKFPPVIADILTRANEYRDADKARMQELKTIFQTCHSWYPTDLTDKDDMNAFMAAIKSERFEDAKTKALKIKGEIINAEILTKPFKEYVNEISRAECDKRITDAT